MSSRPASVERVARALAQLGLPDEIVMTDSSARTAAEAAAALGVTVAEIAKSLVFVSASGKGVLVVAAGDNRVDEAKVAALLGEPISRADPNFVRNTTGFAIGGVAPIAHANPMAVFCDQTLARFARVWAAAGAPHAVFPIEPRTLFAATGGRVGDVRASS